MERSPVNFQQLNLNSLTEDNMNYICNCLLNPITSRDTIALTQQIARIGRAETIIFSLNQIIRVFLATPKEYGEELAPRILKGINAMLEELDTKSIDFAGDVITPVLKLLLSSISTDNISRALDILNLSSLQRFSKLPQLREQMFLMHYVSDYYCTGELLGKGQWGNVYKGYHKDTGTPVALKKMTYQDKPEHLRKVLQREIQVMKYINHPSVIRLYDAILDKTGHYLYMVMEFCQRGDLENYFVVEKNGKLKIDEIKQIMGELATSLKFLRSKNIVHRDLKPANILIFSEEPALKLKLCDFTYAKVLTTEDLTKTICGSPLYMAPEILNGQPYTEKSDLWSVGVILYRLIYNDFPFNAKNPISLAQVINNGEVRLPQTPSILPDTRGLLQSLLQKDPYERISWSEFFIHSFLNSYSLQKPSPSLPIVNPIHDNMEELEIEVKLWRQKFSDAENQSKLLLKKYEDLRTDYEKYKQNTSEHKLALEKMLSDTKFELLQMTKQVQGKENNFRETLKDLREEKQGLLEVMKVLKFEKNETEQTCIIIRAENDKLKKDNIKLHTENTKLKDEIKDIHIEFTRVVDVNHQLKIHLKTTEETEHLLQQEVVERESVIEKLRNGQKYIKN